MHVLVVSLAADPTTDPAPPGEAGESEPDAAAVAGWWRAGAPAARVAALHLSDGRHGFLAALADVVPDVVDMAPARGVAGRRTGGAAPTLFLDAGDVAWSGGSARSRGSARSGDSGALGRLLADAAPRGGASRVVVATARAAADDAGEGMLRALAAAARAPGVDAALEAREQALERPAGPAGAGGAGAGGAGAGGAGAGGAGAGVAPPDGQADAAALLRTARAALAGVDLVAAVEDDRSLSGPAGAPRNPEAADFVARLGRAAVGGGHGTTLAGLPLLGAPSRPASPARLPARLPGSASGGGVAFAIATLGGRILPALRVVADAVDLGGRVAAADVAVAVVPVLDGDQLAAGLVAMVAEAAAATGVPVVVLTADLQAGRREWSAAGVSGAYPLGAAPAAAVARIAHTWTPMP